MLTDAARLLEAETKKLKLPSLAGVPLGLGDPIFFSFNSLPDGRFIGHGICFLSMAVTDHCEYKLFGHDRHDARIDHLVHYLIQNFVGDPLRKELKDIVAQIDEAQKQIVALKVEAKAIELDRKHQPKT